MNKREKRVSEEQATFYCDCSGCGKEIRWSAVPYPAVCMIRICENCGTVNANLRASETVDCSIYKMRDETLSLLEAVSLVFSEIQEPMTVRGMFYQLTSKLQVLPKEESSYVKVTNLLTDMRWRGWLDWYLIVDQSRFYFRSTSYTDAKNALDETARLYRKDLWQGKKNRVEIWLEKKALIGIMQEVTDNYHVSLLPVSGFNSLSQQKQTADAINRFNGCTHIYHFGDFDPSGVCAANTTKETLKDMGAKDFTFTRAAVTEEQIRKWNLPTRPTKKSDTRAKGFSDISVELDAIEPRKLKALVEECILNHISREEIEYIRSIEQQERQILKQLQLSA